jgi:hypothetical protein
MNEWLNQIIDVRKSIQRWTEGDEPEVSQSDLGLQMLQQRILLYKLQYVYYV